MTNTINSTYLYDPDNWLISLHRSLREYILRGFKNSVKNGNGDSIGDQVYQVEFDFPGSDQLARLMPLQKTLIHFVVDDIENPILGFGDAVVSRTPDPTNTYMIEEEAVPHVVNYDVGIWASDDSGGSTARLEAYQVLNSLFSGPLAMNGCRVQTGGVEIRSFVGGRFIIETINDVPVFRTVDTTLVVRVYERNTPDLEDRPLADEIVQNPGLTVMPGDQSLTP